MKVKFLLVVSAALLFLLLASAAVFGMSSAGYQLDWFVPLSGGGGRSSSNSYTADYSLGQAVAGPSTSPSYKAGLGYWYGIGSQHAFFLPYVKKIVSNIPVLASVCFMRPIYRSQYSNLQELFVKFMAMGCRNCYFIENISNILRRMKVNGGDFILKWYSGGIFPQNTSRVEKMRIILY